MARRRNFIDRLPLAPVFALLFGTAVAIVIAAMPPWRFEQAIAWSSLGALLPVAQPPLGLKARLLAVALGFALVAIIVWLAVVQVERLLAAPPLRATKDADDEFDLGGYASGVAPLDAPRRPIFADRELGAPFMSDEALATAAPVFAPKPAEAIDMPEAQIVAEPPLLDNAPEKPIAGAALSAGPIAANDTTLEAPLDVAEFDLPHIDVEESEFVAGESSIDTLIRRLEAGMARRAGSPPPPNPSAPATNPLTAMRELLAFNRESDADNDPGSARALDTLQRLAARRIAG